MTQITIDSETGARLEGLLETVEIVDASGRILGTFRPTIDKAIYKELEPPVPLEELLRRSATPGGYTTEEVLKHLESL